MPTDTVPAVVVRDLNIRYGPAAEVAAVNGLDLEAGQGEVLVVLGPNGAGKTSTIEALEGYRRPTSGQLRVLGPDLAHQADDGLQVESGAHAAVRERAVQADPALLVHPAEIGRAHV